MFRIYAMCVFNSAVGLFNGCHVELKQQEDRGVIHEIKKKALFVGTCVYSCQHGCYDKGLHKISDTFIQQQQEKGRDSSETETCVSSQWVLDGLTVLLMLFRSLTRCFSSLI